MTSRVHSETHPISARAGLVRALRALRNVRGWERLSYAFVSGKTATGPFVVKNRTGWFAGDLSASIDRGMYLRGEYEEDKITGFLTAGPSQRSGVILDIGAGSGPHSLAFLDHFAAIHSFEPNPEQWTCFERNMALNEVDKCTLHKVILVDSDGVDISRPAEAGAGDSKAGASLKPNLRQEGSGKIRRAALAIYLKENNLQDIDSIRIDIPGSELEIIKGLRDALERNKPFVWVRLAGDTAQKLKTVEELKTFFPFPTIVSRFLGKKRGLFNSVSLGSADEDGGRLMQGDYFVAPANWAMK